jgi:F0F1-type ATP synthase assembly protein I
MTDSRTSREKPDTLKIALIAGVLLGLIYGILIGFIIGIGACRR